MKKLIAILFTAILLLSCAGSAMAASYATTADFEAALDNAGVRYTNRGLTDGESERITIGNTDSSINLSYTVTCYFNKNQNKCEIYVFNLINLASGDVTEAYRICSQLNYDYNFAKFYVDETDNSITAQITVIFNDSSYAGDLTLRGVYVMADIIADGYETYKHLIK